MSATASPGMQIFSQTSQFALSPTISPANWDVLCWRDLLNQEDSTRQPDLNVALGSSSL